MENRARKIIFTEKEKREGANVVQLGRDGRFTADYVVPEERRAYGLWRPSDAVCEEFGFDKTKRPFKAMVHYVPKQKELERLIVEDIMPETNCLWASLFTLIGWERWVIELKDERAIDMKSKGGVG